MVTEGFEKLFSEFHLCYDSGRFSANFQKKSLRPQGTLRETPASHEASLPDIKESFFH